MAALKLFCTSSVKQILFIVTAVLVCPNILQTPGLCLQPLSCAGASISVMKRDPDGRSKSWPFGGLDPHGPAMRASTTARTGYPVCEAPLKIAPLGDNAPLQALWHLLSGLPAASMFCRAQKWAPCTPNMTGLQILCPQVNSPSYLVGSCSGSTKITFRPSPCLLYSFASKACRAAVLHVSPQSHAASRAPWHCSGLLEKTTQGPCGLNKGTISTAHICFAKPPSISSAELQSGQLRNDVLLLVYCCCCLGFPWIKRLWSRVSRTEMCPASGAAEHSVKEVMGISLSAPSALMAVGAID